MVHLTWRGPAALSKLLIYLIITPQTIAAGFSMGGPSVNNPFEDLHETINGIEMPHFPPNYDFTQLTAHDLEFVPPEALLEIDGERLGEMAATFSREQLRVVCENLLGTDPDTAEQLMGNINCAATFSQLAAMNDPMSEDMAQAAVAAMRNNHSPASWSSEDWQTALRMPAGLQPEDISHVPRDVLINNIAYLSAHAGALEPELVDRFLDRLIDMAGGLGAFNSSILAAMGNMLNFMDAEDFRGISKVVKKDALMQMRNVRLADDIATDFYDDVIGDFGSPTNWSSADVISMADLIKYDSKLIGDIPMDSFARSINELGRMIMDQVEARGFADRLLEMPGLPEASSWDLTMMATIKNLMGSFPLTFMEQFDDTTILDAVDSSVISSVPFTKSSSRSILEKVSNKLGGMERLDAEIIANLGTTLKSLRASDAAALDANTAVMAIGTLSESYNDMEESTRNALLDKFQDQTLDPEGMTGSLALQLGPFFKQLSLDQIDELPFYIFNATYLQITEPLQVTMTQAQASRVMWQVERRFGSPANFSMKMWKTLGGAICGLSCDVIKMLPDNRHFRGLVSHIAARPKPCLGDAQMRCMAQRVHTYLWGQETSGNQDVSRATPSTIRKVAAFLPYLSHADLRVLPMAVCGTVVKSIGRRPLDSVPRSTLINLMKYALKCVNKETSGTVTLGDVKYVGDIICGVEEADVSRLEDQFYTNRILKIGEKCRLPLTVERAIAAQARTALKISLTNVTTGQLVKMGPALVHLSDEELAQLNKTSLRKAAVRILNSFKKRSNMVERRHNTGMTTDITDTESKACRQAELRFLKLLTTEFEKQRLVNTPGAEIEATTGAVQQKVEGPPPNNAGPPEPGVKPGSNGLDGDGGGWGRGRRSIATSVLTCSDMLHLGNAVVTFSTEQLNLAHNEFLNCAETLGRQTGFSDAQKQTLAIVARGKMMWGPPGTWTDTQIISAGVIAQGLSAEHLLFLPLTTTDTVSALGKYTGWTSQQLSIVFSRWLDLSGTSESSRIDATQLKSIGEFACGTTTTQINTISSASYQSAAAMIGQLVSCDQSQMAAFVNHATTVFGDVTEWDSAVVGTIGTMIGGLSTNQLSGLTLPQIQALQPKAISNMPPQAFAGFTVSQLRQFSVAQAQCVTPSQRGALSADKQKALKSAEAVEMSDIPGNSATTPGNSRSALVVLVFVLFTKTVIVV